MMDVEHDANGHFAGGPTLSQQPPDRLAPPARPRRPSPRGVVALLAAMQRLDEPKAPARRRVAGVDGWAPAWLPPAPPTYTDVAYRRAHRQYAAALRAGTLVRPDACACCTRVTRVVGHHVDYDRPLDVLWLCDRCHALAHSQRLPARLAHLSA